MDGVKEMRGERGNWFDLFKYLLVILLVISLGLFSINQFISFRAKMVFIKTPCELCKELNPHLDICFESASIYSLNNYTLELKEKKNYSSEEYYDLLAFS